MDRRARAADLFERGLSRARVARLLGVCRATTTHWYRTWKEHGRDALVTTRKRGRPPKIGADDLVRIGQALSRRPREWGYELESWSLASAAALIERLTGVKYHHRHVGRLIRRTGWIVPPVGPGKDYALRRCEARDPDGNTIALLERYDRSHE